VIAIVVPKSAGSTNAVSLKHAMVAMEAIVVEPTIGIFTMSTVPEVLYQATKKYSVARLRRRYGTGPEALKTREYPEL
jgi:hypothetical protein